MSYVIYNECSTELLTDRRFKTETAAKSARTRILKKQDDASSSANDYVIAETGEFYANIEKQVQRKNLMTGKTFLEGVNTPIHMSPASETYWSM